MTSCEVAAGTTANIGAVTTVPDWAAVTLIVVVPIWVRLPGYPSGEGSNVLCIETDRDRLGQVG